MYVYHDEFLGGCKEWKTTSNLLISFQVLLSEARQEETFLELEQSITDSLPHLFLIGKTQEAVPKANVIASVLNFYALQNGSAGMQERQRVIISLNYVLFPVLVVKCLSWYAQMSIAPISAPFK